MLRFVVECQGKHTGVSVRWSIELSTGGCSWLDGCSGGCHDVDTFTSRLHPLRGPSKQTVPPYHTIPPLLCYVVHGASRCQQKGCSPLIPRTVSYRPLPVSPAAPVDCPPLSSPPAPSASASPRSPASVWPPVSLWPDVGSRPHSCRPLSCVRAAWSGLLPLAARWREGSPGRARLHMGKGGWMRAM